MTAAMPQSHKPSCLLHLNKLHDDKEQTLFITRRLVQGHMCAEVSEDCSGKLGVLDAGSEQQAGCICHRGAAIPQYIARPPEEGLEGST